MSWVGFTPTRNLLIVTSRHDPLAEDVSSVPYPRSTSVHPPVLPWAPPEPNKGQESICPSSHQVTLRSYRSPKPPNTLHQWSPFSPPDLILMYSRVRRDSWVDSGHSGLHSTLNSVRRRLSADQGLEPRCERRSGPRVQPTCGVWAARPGKGPVLVCRRRAVCGPPHRGRDRDSTH